MSLGVYDVGGILTTQEPTRNEQVAVGTSVVAVAPARQSANARRQIILRNVSPNATDIIYVTLGNATASATSSGIVLRQYDVYCEACEGNWQTGESGFLPWQGAISAICATATGSLAVYEK